MRRGPRKGRLGDIWDHNREPRALLVVAIKYEDGLKILEPFDEVTMYQIALSKRLIGNDLPSMPGVQQIRQYFDISGAAWAVVWGPILDKCPHHLREYYGVFG